MLQGADAPITIVSESHGPSAAAITSDEANYRQGEITTEDANQSHGFTDSCPPTSPVQVTSPAFDSDMSSDHEVYQDWDDNDFKVQEAEAKRQILYYQGKITNLYLKISRLEFNRMRIRDPDGRPIKSAKTSSSAPIKTEPKAPPSDQAIASCEGGALGSGLIGMLEDVLADLIVRPS